MRTTKYYVCLVVLCLSALPCMIQSQDTAALRANRNLKMGQHAVTDGEEHANMNTPDMDAIAKQYQEAAEEEYYEDADVSDPVDHKQAPESIRGENRTLENLSRNFQEAKVRMMDRLVQEYGQDVVDDIWMDDCVGINLPHGQKRCTMGRMAFIKGSAGENAKNSWYSVKVKMVLNLLEYMLTGEVQDFVWVTAGNSDAAGHGNFFGEQYTMVMKDRARDLFHSVGLDLVARPYGIGGQTSAPEAAGCAKELYGDDVDIITWDFAMTDGRWYWRLEFFAHRVAMLPNFPALLVLQPGTDEKRREITNHLSKQGLAILRQEEKYVIDQQLKMPDSSFRSEEDLAEMTDSVRYFRCGYGIEYGPGCLENKFTHNGTCDERSHRTNWHHGWKWHAFHGNLYALFLMEIMEDAIAKLENYQGDLRDLYDKLSAQERAHFEKFESEAEIRYTKEWKLKNVEAIELMRSKTYCRTALLPAETRYNGLVFDKPAKRDWFDYRKGWQKWAVEAEPSRKMLLTRISKKKGDKCSVPLNIDDRDFFSAMQVHEGYQSITIPNDSEVNYYGKHKPKGIIMVCAQTCGQECKGSKLLGPEAIARPNQVHLKVNGQMVGHVTKMDNCFLLQQQDGSLHWPSQDGRYTIEADVVGWKKELRFTSFIVW